MEDIEKRSQQCLEVLAIALVGCNARLESCTCLWQKPFSINFQQLGCFLLDFVFASKFKGDLLRLNFGLTAGAVQFSFRLRKFGLLASATIDRNANAERHHVVGTELSGIGPLPHVLKVEVWIEVL